MGVLAQGTPGLRESGDDPELPSLTCIYTATRNKSDFQICGSQAGFVRHGLMGRKVCCKDVEKLRGWGSSGHTGRVWGRSLRRGRGLGSCDCPHGLFVHPESGLAGQVSLGPQTGLPAPGS